MTTPRTLVIGSGLGGAAATLTLAHAGLPVTLLEKNRSLGGSCAQYDKRGFKLDVGTHMFSRGPKGPLGDLLRRVGRANAVEFKRTRDIAELRVRGKGGMLDPIAVPASAARMPKFAWELVRAMGLSPSEAARAAHLFSCVLAMPDERVRELDSVTVQDFLEPFGLHDGVAGLFGFLLGLYFVVPYWEASAGEAIWCFQRMLRDNHLSYPMGGSQAVPVTFCRIAEEHGATLRTNAGVERILVEGGRVRGVRLSSGEELEAECVISTSSVRTTALHLLDTGAAPQDWVDKSRTIKGSYIAVQAKFALDRPLLKAGAIVGGVGEDQDLFSMSLDQLKGLFEDVATGRIPRCVPFYCPIPTNFDPSLAPPGHQLLTACAVAPTTDIQLLDPAEKWETAMVEALHSVVPGLEEHTLWVDRFSTRWLESWIGKEYGPAISTAQIPGQVGDHRPPVTTPIEGLYIAGCGAGARGVGTELACAAGMEAADTILATQGRQRWMRRVPKRERLLNPVLKTYERIARPD